MRHWSIRARLTTWFATVLGLALIVLAATTWWTLQQRFTMAIDKELAGRVESIGRFLNQQASPASVDEMQDDLQEYISLDPGWNLIRITDSRGSEVYRSASFDPTGLPPVTSALAARGPVYRDVRMRRHPLRLITSRVVGRQQAYTVDVAVPLGEFREALDQLGWTLALLMPVGILAAAMGGYWISRRALAPIDSITSTARFITAQELRRRLDVPTTGDELQRLSETLNAMLDRLEDSFRETSRFTADASHELRTPISLIRTAAEVALRIERPAHEYRCTLENILHEAERMSSLVQDLLTLVRADAGVDGAQRSPLDLRVLISDMSDSLSALCAPRTLEFQLDVGDRPVPVAGDHAALSRLVFILVDNAVHYTPPPGQVSLSLRCDDGMAVMDVTDTGIGIGAEDLPHVFDRFYRADRARSRDSGGSGLGLSIAKWIAERHGGRVGIKSAPGLGCRVRVELPCTAPAASPSTSAAVLVEP